METRIDVVRPAKRSLLSRALKTGASVATKAAVLTGKAAGKVASAAGKKAYKHREQIGEMVATTAKLATKGVFATGKAVYTHRNKIATAAKVIGGATIGTAKAAHDTVQSGYALATIDGEELRGLEETIHQQSLEYARLTPKRRFSPRQKHLALDTLVVGGNTLAYYMNHPVPPEIERAFALQYPHLAAHESFADAIKATSSANLEGLISGVKGKLFELQYVDYLNDGHLPAGYAAVLASSATQPGWDFQIVGPDGHVAQQIQLKATDSVDHVKHALERYPSIDVVSTSEVHSHLVMQGFGEHVADGHITDAGLTSAVTSAADHATMHMHFAPSIVSAAIIAYSSYSQADLTQYQKSRQFGERTGKSYLAYLVGGSIAVVTQTWWIGLISSVGSRVLLGQGRKKRERRDRLVETIEINEQVLNRLRVQLRA